MKENQAVHSELELVGEKIFYSCIPKLWMRDLESFGAQGQPQFAKCKQSFRRLKDARP